MKFRVLLNQTVSKWLGPNFHCINPMNRSRARAAGHSNVSFTPGLNPSLAHFLVYHCSYILLCLHFLVHHCSSFLLWSYFLIYYCLNCLVFSHFLVYHCFSFLVNHCFYFPVWSNFLVFFCYSHPQKCRNLSNKDMKINYFFFYFTIS